MPKVESQDEWTLKAKNLLKGELKRKGITYRQLAEKLEAIGASDVRL